MTATAFAQTGASLLTDRWEAGPAGQGREGQWQVDLWGLSTQTKSDGPQSATDSDLIISRSRLSLPLRPTLAPPKQSSGEDMSETPVADAGLSPAFGHELTQIYFSGDDPRVPPRLVRQEAALGLPLPEVEAFGRAWQPGLVLGFGHASTNPYQDGQGWYALATALAVTRLDDGALLTVGVTYDGNRSILPDTPLPLIEYRRQLDPAAGTALGFQLGYPESRIYYKPRQDLTLSVGLAQLDAISAEVRWQVAERLALLAAYGGFYDMFHDADDPADRRLYFVSQRLEAGVTYAPMPELALTATAGYAFGQELRRGYDWRSTDEVVSFDAAPFARVAVRIQF